jgi:uncharacterized glyoxalase superfamily protein PhnB
LAVSNCSRLQAQPVLGGDRHRPGRPAVGQRRLRGGQQPVGLHRLAVAALQLADKPGAALLDAFEIGQHQLGVDGVGIGQRVDPTLDMGDIVIGKAAQHMGDRIDLADIGQELVAQPLALRGALHQPGNIDKGDSRRNHAGRPGDRRQPVEPRIGHRNIAGIGLDRAEREIRRLGGRCPRQRVEKRRLAHIRQADDAQSEAHRTLRSAIDGSVGNGRRPRKALGRPAIAAYPAGTPGKDPPMPLCPYLFFDGTCRAAMTAYAEILGGTVEAMETYAKAPPGEPRPEGGDTLIMHASIRLADGSWLMASDDWPGRYTPPASTHVLVTPPDAETARLHRHQRRHDQQHQHHAEAQTVDQRDHRRFQELRLPTPRKAAARGPAPWSAWSAARAAAGRTPRR